MTESANTDWWLNSGGRLTFRDGVGKTLRGELPVGDRWRVAYERGDPLDTEAGAHPQNLFRLVTRQKWLDARQELRFRVRTVSASGSLNRNETNGVLLFHRYQDGDSLYYAGLRFDGAAVIKKKHGGIYSTLAYRQIYGGTWDRDQLPSLVPVDRWLGLRTEIEDEPGGGVRIAVFVQDPERGEEWKEAVAAVDLGKEAPQIVHEGHAGIRTDFAEVEFDDYRIEPIERE
ncbi:MAG: hypothetical protein ACREQJ_02320 [Candidatus Binatia bacterium]